eukprot:m.142171 g.142171  ORF g.142171 m.142171 type:complete len:737 (-) comp16146_c0_seq1:45-2255(-)
MTFTPQTLFFVHLCIHLAAAKTVTVSLPLAPTPLSLPPLSSFSARRSLSDVAIARSELDDLFSTALISWPDTTASSLVIVTQRFGSQGVAESHVYSSQDAGLNWNRSIAVPNSARVSTLQSSHVPNKFYLVGAQTIYITSDGGRTFKLAINASSDIIEFSLHPTFNDVFTYSTAGQLHLAFADGAIVQDLLDLSKAYLVQSEWLVLASNQVKLVAEYRHPQLQTVGIFKYTLQTNTATQQAVLPEDNVTILPNSLLVVGATIFAHTSLAGARAWLVASADDNTLSRVALPTVARRLTMLENNQDVLHFALEDTSGRDQLYAWDNVSTDPVLVLPQLNCFGTSCDLVCSELVLGLCLANQPGAGPSLRTTSGGGQWEQLTIEDRSFCEIGDKCPLRLLMGAAQAFNRLQFTPTEFSDAAAYLVFGIATTRSQVTVTVVSNDGGITWKRSSSTVLQHQAVDHGSVLLMADVYNPLASVGDTNVSYSVNEGQNFTSLGITEEAMHMIALLSHPAESSTSAIVVGYDVNQTADDPRWVIVGIDFGQALGRDCTSTDFERWSLKEAGCSNGVRQQFQRRTPDAVCRIGPDFQVSAPLELCNCTREDFVCADQFVLADGMCVPSTGACASEPVPAYQRSLLNRCQGGLSLNQEQVTLPACPPDAASSKRSASTPFTIVLIVFGALAAVAILGVLVVKYIRNRGATSPQPVAFVNPVYDQGADGNDDGMADDDGGYIEVQGVQ